MLYRALLMSLKTPLGMRAWASVRKARGRPFRNRSNDELVRRLAPGRSFLDVGCMWGVDGEYAFTAEAVGATRSTGVDVFGPTPGFTERRERDRSAVEFVLGDVSDPAVIERLGTSQVVLCSGVLYHHPAPFDLLVALRAVCSETLIVRSSTIPELPGLRNMAVFWPGIPTGQRRLWDRTRLGLGPQYGVTTPFLPAEGYGNWFWGLTPSAFASLLALAGFAVQETHAEPWVTTFVCRVVDVPFVHRVPDPGTAARMGEDVARDLDAPPA